jgi:hypothetical protein
MRMVALAISDCRREMRSANHLFTGKRNISSCLEAWLGITTRPTDLEVVNIDHRTAEKQGRDMHIQLLLKTWGREATVFRQQKFSCYRDSWHIICERVLWAGMTFFECLTNQSKSRTLSPKLSVFLWDPLKANRHPSKWNKWEAHKTNQPTNNAKPLKTI